MCYNIKKHTGDTINMKKIIMVLSVVLLCALLFSCSMDDLGANNMNNAKMTAKIIAIGDKIEVEVIEGDYGVSGAFWIITGPDTQFLDSEGNKITRSSLNANDVIEIEYSGQVMMSYPPQVYAKAITIK